MFGTKVNCSYNRIVMFHKYLYKLIVESKTFFDHFKYPITKLILSQNFIFHFRAVVFLYFYNMSKNSQKMFQDFVKNSMFKMMKNQFTILRATFIYS